MHSKVELRYSPKQNNHEVKKQIQLDIQFKVDARDGIDLTTQSNDSF